LRPKPGLLRAVSKCSVNALIIRKNQISTETLPADRVQAKWRPLPDLLSRCETGLGKGARDDTWRRPTKEVNEVMKKLRDTVVCLFD